MSRVPLVLLLAIAMSCDSDRAPSTPPDDAGPTYAIVPDPAALGIDLTTHVAGSRQADADTILAELRTKYPDVLRTLEETDALGGAIVEVEDAELARLLSQLYAIRDADDHARARPLWEEVARRRGVRVERRGP